MNDVNGPETGEEPRWGSERAEHPLATSDPAALRARFEEVATWWAATKPPEWWALVAGEDAKRPEPRHVDAAVSILAKLADDRDVSVIVNPATLWDVGGTLVAVYHQGTHDGPAVDAECSCPVFGLCEHLLVALAGTELRGDQGRDASREP